MASIPDEVLTIIFSGLPVKTLLRFRRLSKSTCSIIDNSEFAKLHLDKSVSNQCDLCLAIDDVIPASTVFYLDLNLDDNYVLEIHRELAFVLEVREEMFLGTCNGLVALYEGFVGGDLQGMTLTNPSINWQQSVGNFWGDEFLDPYHEDVILNGFGYDATNDDYKLVRVRQSRVDQAAKAVVYSSKARVTRKLPGCPEVYAPIAGDRPGVYVAGTLHWIVIKGNVDVPSDSDEDGELEDDDTEELIIGLNLTTETFHIVPHQLQQNQFPMLGELHGCLAICSTHPVTLDLEVWMMKEYGEATSWTRLVTISQVEQEVFGLPRSISKALYLSRKEDRILIETVLPQTFSSHLFWYNIALGRIEYFEVFANLPSSRFSAELVSRSLISLPGFQN